ncbi:MAG TPA: ABC transporter permease, partial [Gammaproteobacteria bacterium]|nr:ABC transporter permease [Gammaproteobacteria bacterium]
MKTIRTVFSKEVVDNFRDRRTLLSALIMGPLFGPILFAFVINIAVERSLSNDDETLDLPVIGAQHAPNLITYLKSENINIVAGPATREAAIEMVMKGEHDVVIVIPETFGEDFSETIPATVELITDQANNQAEQQTRRARGALQAYNQQLAVMRLTIRGISPLVMRPLNIDEVDVSTPSGRSVLLLGMLSYF